MEVVAAVSEEVGPGRVAVRLSPTQPGAFDFFGASDDASLQITAGSLTKSIVSPINDFPAGLGSIFMAASHCTQDTLGITYLECMFVPTQVASKTKFDHTDGDSGDF